jgi:FAD/FMN-containing dehydrogenase
MEKEQGPIAKVMRQRKALSDPNRMLNRGKIVK